MISIQNLSKANESNTVFKEISVELLRGTVYGLVGVNGCGKSTLMRCICGFTRPSSGTVTVMGKL
ncbi:MAG: ATP-binding cassette domain-containing protein, partial [Clostridia bacterium]